MGSVAPIAQNEGYGGVIKPPLATRSLPVAASVNAAAGLLVKDNGSGYAVLAATGDTKAVVEGLVQNGYDNSAVAAVSTQRVTIVRKGWCRAYASGAVVAKTLICADNNGKVRAYAAKTDTFDLVIGRAESSATDDVVDIFIDI